MNSHFRFMAWLLHGLSGVTTIASLVQPADRWVAIASIAASVITHLVHARDAKGSGSDPFAEAQDLVGRVVAELTKQRATSSTTSSTASQRSAAGSTPGAGQRS